MTVVFEVLSPSNRATEMIDKHTFYEEYGVEEYYISTTRRTTVTSTWSRETCSAVCTRYRVSSVHSVSASTCPAPRWWCSRRRTGPLFPSRNWKPNVCRPGSRRQATGNRPVAPLDAANKQLETDRDAETPAAAAEQQTGLARQRTAQLANEPQGPASAAHAGRTAGTATTGGTVLWTLKLPARLDCPRLLALPALPHYNQVAFLS